MLADPQAAWKEPAVTTHGFKNHAVRSEDWRYIRYADGSEELYDKTADPLEYKNLAEKPEYAARKAELARALPAVEHDDVPNNPGGATKRAAIKKAAAKKKTARKAAANP